MHIQKITQLEGHLNAVYALVPGAKEHLVLSGSSDKLVIEWNLQTLLWEKIVAKASGIIYSLLHIPEKNLLVIGQQDGSMHVIHLEEKREIKFVRYHQKAIFDLRYYGVQDCVFTLSGDGSISIWLADGFSFVAGIQVADAALRSLDFHPVRGEMVIGCSDSTIRIIDLSVFDPLHHPSATKGIKQKKVLMGHNSSVFCVKYVGGGNQLLSGSRDAHLHIWDVENNYALQQRIPAHYFTLNSIVQSADGKIIATASRDKTIKLWDSSSFTLLKVIDYERHGGHTHSVNKLLWSHYHNYLLSAGDDRNISIWQVQE